MDYPCIHAMVTDAATLKPDHTVEEALAIFKKHDIRNLPVVDDQGKFLGLFGLHQILINLLPKSVTMEHGLESVDFVVGAAPGIAKRLKKLHPIKVSDIMNKKPSVTYCDTSTMEALRIMAMQGSPVVVVDEENGDFKGMITRKTLLDDLYGLLEEIEKTEESGE